MNAITTGLPVSEALVKVLPETVSGSEKAGNFVPRAIMRD
jgi:hypothetical protein